MGSSSSYSSSNKCDQSISFLVVIDTDNCEKVWKNCEVNLLVELELREGSNQEDLPELLIVEVMNDFIIGNVPSSFSWILKCLNAGWRYEGKIRKKDGNQYDPQIAIILKATKL